MVAESIAPGKLNEVRMARVRRSVMLEGIGLEDGWSGIGRLARFNCDSYQVEVDTVGHAPRRPFGAQRQRAPSTN